MSREGLTKRLEEAMPTSEDQGLGAICAVLICLGVGWRISHLGSPSSFCFDEFHFVENAREYLHRKADWNDHPPLGKLALVPWMAWLGDHAFAWRINSCLHGLALIALVGLVAWELTKNWRPALMASALVAMDGFFVSYSRVALLDTPMTTLMVAAFWLMLRGKRPMLEFALAAFLMGLAVSYKWTSAVMAPVVPVLLWRQRRSIFHSVWFGAIMVVVHLAIWHIARVISRQPADVVIIVRNILELHQHHAAFTDWHNPADSPWYTWPFLVHPLLMWHSQMAHGKVRVFSSIGNLVLWPAVTVGWFATISALAVIGYRWVRARFDRAFAWTGWPVALTVPALMLFTALSLLWPWLPAKRESYIWHYLGAYCFGVILVAEWVGMRLWPRRPHVVIWSLVACGLFAISYAPVNTGQTVDQETIDQLLFLPTWRVGWPP